jgi:hypothetical protein
VTPLEAFNPRPFSQRIFPMEEECWPETDAILQEVYYLGQQSQESIGRLLEALEKARVIVGMAYSTAEWIQYHRTAESDDAVDFIDATLRKAKGEIHKERTKS